ncbi:MAG: aldehyde dehydrogenase family protein [Actinomycetota bacterium]|nr:aldehyde dehydrogenase family protein [Actinomycetota bacterium]
MSSPLNIFTGLYIDGAWRRGSGEREILDPTTGKRLAGAATASIEECLEAVDAASAAQPAWASTPPRQRAEVLRQCFELMVRERDAIADLIQRENGKALRQAIGEVYDAAEFFRWGSEEAAHIGGDFRTVPNGDEQIVVLSEPIGVALLITPWSFPAATATRQIAPALAAGCTCVLKPAPETPLTALYLADLVRRAGAPPGVLNVVLPDPPVDAVAAMMGHRSMGKLSFTGSTSVGRSLLELAGKHLLETSMGVGGNAPFVVLDDADLDIAVEAALLAKMTNAGASCIAANQFYVHERIATEFISRFTARMAELSIGYGREADTDVGALVSACERDRVGQLLAEFIESGGEVTTGGRASGTSGFFFEPTVVADVPIDAPTLGSEIFGPLAPIVVFDDLDEVITHANAADAAPISYIISRDVTRAFGLSRRMDTGMVAINRGRVSDPAVSFGGFQHSGAGAQGGSEGIAGYLKRKYVGLEL